jgi:hypothetical protein
VFETNFKLFTRYICIATFDHPNRLYFINLLASGGNWFDRGTDYPHQGFRDFSFHSRRKTKKKQDFTLE